MCKYGKKQNVFDKMLRKPSTLPGSEYSILVQEGITWTYFPVYFCTRLRFESEEHEYYHSKRTIAGHNTQCILCTASCTASCTPWCGAPQPGWRLFLGGLSSLLSSLLWFVTWNWSLSSILSRRWMGTLRTASPPGTDCELTARGDSGAGLWFRARYSTVGDRWPSPIVQGLLGGLAQSGSRFLRLSVKELAREKELGETQRAGREGGVEKGGDGEGVVLRCAGSRCSTGRARGRAGELPGSGRAGEEATGAGRAGDARLRTGELMCRGELGQLEGWETTSSLSCGWQRVSVTFNRIW